MALDDFLAPGAWEGMWQFAVPYFHPSSDCGIKELEANLFGDSIGITPR